HPYDAKGRRCEYSELPKTIKTMEDDLYRSLAGELRAMGGFAKDSTPFSEFLWADFLRPRIKAKAIKADFAAALTEALTLAKTGEAGYLPGWCGPRHNAPQPSGTAKKQNKAEGASLP
ncbi:MAG TPA: ParB-like protein, partial [Roseiarcus sp.]|nr:ParB-like protein [Roseiarcus sp.]